jgi:hypothetical protein
MDCRNAAMTPGAAGSFDTQQNFMQTEVGGASIHLPIAHSG